jgi:hypothetical protein
MVLQTVHSPTGHFLPFGCLSISSSPNGASFPLYNEMKLWYSNPQWTQRKLNAPCISAAAKVFVCTRRRALLSCSFNERAWHWCMKQRFFCSLTWISICSLFCPFCH